MKRHSLLYSGNYSTVELPHIEINDNDLLAFQEIHWPIRTVYQHTENIKKGSGFKLFKSALLPHIRNKRQIEGCLVFVVLCTGPDAIHSMAVKPQ